MVGAIVWFAGEFGRCRLLTIIGRPKFYDGEMVIRSLDPVEVQLNYLSFRQTEINIRKDKLVLIFFCRKTYLFLKSMLYFLEVHLYSKFHSFFRMNYNKNNTRLLGILSRDFSSQISCDPIFWKILRLQFGVGAFLRIGWNISISLAHDKISHLNIRQRFIVHPWFFFWYKQIRTFTFDIPKSFIGSGHIKIASIDNCFGQRSTQNFFFGLFKTVLSIP